MTEELLAAARRAALTAYAPYSRFRVGAAVSAAGTTFPGCNVENASYGLTICAERTAIFAAVAAGHRRIDCVAVACIDGGESAALMPCGACLQVMHEFGGATLTVAVDRAGVFALSELLPRGFALA